MKSDPFMDLIGRSETEKGGTVPDPELLQEQLVGVFHVLPVNADRRICEKSADRLPPVAVIPAGRQTDAPVVRFKGEINGIEPVARVIAVPVKRFGPQNIGAHLVEGHTLAVGDERIAEQVHADTGIHIHVERQFGLGIVPQGFVVVLVDVVHRLLGQQGVADHFITTVNKITEPVYVVVGTQVAGHSDTDPVGLFKQMGKVLAGIAAVRHNGG